MQNIKLVFYQFITDHNLIHKQSFQLVKKLMINTTEVYFDKV